MDGIVKPPDSKVDIERAIELRNRGLSFKEIGAIYNAAETTVAHLLQKYLTKEKDPDVEIYKEHRTSILASHQSKILKAIENKNLEEEDLKSLATAFGIFYDKERLESGKSTQNLSSFSLMITKIHRDGLESASAPVGADAPTKVDEDVGDKVIIDIEPQIVSST